MADGVQIQAIGQQLAATFVEAYGSAHFGGSLAFLPFGVSVPQDLVQAGPSGAPMVNVTAVQAWLEQNFDLPFIISADQGAVLQPDASHNATSQIYAQVVSFAQPLGAAGDPAWARVDAEIAAAQQSLGPPGIARMLACEPDDWAMPTANAGYWTKFDSTDAQSTSTQKTTQTPLPTPVVHPEFWMVRSLAVAPVATSPAPPPAAEAATVPVERFPLQAIEVSAPPSPTLAATAVGHPVLAASEVEAIRPVLSSAAVASVPAQPAPALSPTVLSRASSLILFKKYAPVQTATASMSSSSTITVHLEHQYVSLGYVSAGQPWWNQTFLADPGWYVPGMKAAGILPAAEGAADAQYARPIGLIVVQNLKVSGQWSADAAAALNSSGGSIGPLSLIGATTTTGSDGVTVTYERDGMQVVALLCTTLPVLPPADDPKLDPPTASSLIGLGLGLAENLLGGGSASGGASSDGSPSETSSGSNGGSPPTTNGSASAGSSAGSASPSSPPGSAST